MSKTKNLFLGGTCLFAVGMMPSVNVNAAEQRSSLLLEEITVTAQKREESLRDVSVAVTAFTGDQMAKLGFSDSTDIVSQVPGLEVGSVSGGASIVLFNIRGVNQNDFADHHESPIAIYEDEAYVASMTMASFPLFDLERVETLKGPQGTIFGRNATGGLIHFITRKPDVEDLSGYARAKYGSFDQLEVEGAVNVPLNDKAAIRLSGIRSKHDGYLKNRIGEDRHERNVYALRGQLLLNMSENFELLLKGHYNKNDNEATGAYTQQASIASGPNGTGEPIGPDENPWGTCNGCDSLGYFENDGDPLSNEYDFAGFLDREIYGTTLRMTWSNDDIEVVSLTDYRKSNKEYAEDGDGSSNPLLNFATIAKVSTFSQELRVSGDSDELEWLVGANFLKINGDYGSKIWYGSEYLGIDGVDGLYYDTHSFWEQDKESWAIFGQGSYAVSDKLTAVLGLRYTHDKITHDWENTVTTDLDGLFDINGALLGAVTSFADESSDNLFDFHVLLEYRPNEDWMVYAGVTQGSKGAGYAALFQPDYAERIPFGREKLLSYEAGAKGTLMDGAAFLSGAIFYYDYTDYQAFVLDGLAQRVQNVDAHIFGGEVELMANPVEGLDLSVGAAFLFDTKAKGVLMPDGSFVDQELPIAPNVSLNGLIRYSFDVPIGIASVQVDGNYRDKVNFAVINHATTVGESYAVLNARISIAAEDDSWEIAGFVRNLTNKDYKTYAIDISSFGLTDEQWARPRWWGAEALFRF